jgi:CRP/FNR family transcriptional regulator
MESLFKESFLSDTQNIFGRTVTATDNPISNCSTLGDFFSQVGIEREYILSSAITKFHHIKITPGQFVFTSGDNCKAIYFVFAGFLKKTWGGKDGIEKVISFPMKNDILGIEALCSKTHKNNLIALTQCELIEIPIKFLNGQEKESDTFRKFLLNFMSEQLIKEQKSSYIVSSFPSDIRVVKFILGLASRFKSLGFSDKNFVFRMTQEDIGSYLGVTNETVSRAISSLCSSGLINKKNRAIEILNFEELKKLGRLPDNLSLCL